MSIPSLISAACVLAVASTASAAEDKSNATSPQKPVTTLTKAAKGSGTVKPAAAALGRVTAKTANDGRTNENTPAAKPGTATTSERTYEGCHGKESDA